MKKEFTKLFRVYIFDKNFTGRNAGGYPPNYMFSGKNPIGCKYDMYGESEQEVLEYVNSCLSEDIKEKFKVMVNFLEEVPAKVINE